MKKLSLIILLIAFELSADAQKIDSIVFKKAQKIIVKNSHTAAENFKIAGMALIDKGYMISSKDEQFNQITSGPIKANFAVQFIYVIAKDNEIDITSRSKSTTTFSVTGFSVNDPAFEPVVYSKNNDNVIERFKNMTDLAKLIGGDKILYSEQ